jgi:Right handed beta helix region
MRSYLGQSVLLSLTISLTGALGCGGDGASASTSTSTSTNGSSAGGGGAASTSSSASTSSGGGAGGGGGAPGDVGVWTDAPGACPAGIPKVDITTAAQLASAARGEDAFAGDAPSTCYFLHNGTYKDNGVILYITKGGAAGGARRYFIGESRAGVIINGRGNIEDGVSDVTVENLTMDLTGYPKNGEFDTLTVGTGKNITLDHLTFTGDCATGHKGGHIEPVGTKNLLVEACLIEKFGGCGANGHEDHGVYIAAGSGLVFRNNIIRENSSRGIQMYTQSGDFGTIDDVLIERNLFQKNGHGNQEDGLLVSSSGAGKITKITVQRNIFDSNWYSGIRFVGGSESGVVVTRNTFSSNSVGSTSVNRSDINVDTDADDKDGAAGTTFTANIFNVGYTLINDCFDGKARAFTFGDNFVNGKIAAGAKGNCVGAQTLGDPQFADAAKGDFHPKNPAAAAYGAYAP